MKSDPTARLERLIGRILRIGSVASTVLLVAGLLLRVVLPAAAAADVLLFSGLMLLLATPIARVVATVAEYALARDWRYALCALLVQAVVVGSLVYGLAT